MMLARLFLVLFFILFSQINFSIVKNVINLQIDTSIGNIESLVAENTMTISQGNLIVEGNVVLNGNTAIIGNNIHDTIISVPNIPLLSTSGQYYNYMIGFGSNTLYLGDQSSPNPPPDFIIIPNIQTNQIIPFMGGASEYSMNFDALYGGGIILGNQNISLNCTAPIVNFHESDPEKELKQKINCGKFYKNSNYSITFSCPSIVINRVVSEGSITVSNINMTTNSVVVSNVINCPNLTIAPSVTVFGKSNLSSTIPFGGGIFKTANIIFGNSTHLISKITDVQEIDEFGDNTAYVLFSKKENALAHSPRNPEMAAFRIKEIDEEKFVNFINDNNKVLLLNGINTESNTDLYFRSPIIVFEGQSSFQGPCYLYFPYFEGACKFTDCASDKNIVFDCQNDLKLLPIDKEIKISLLLSNNIMIQVEKCRVGKKIISDLDKNTFLVIDDTGLISEVSSDYDTNNDDLFLENREKFYKMLDQLIKENNTMKCVNEEIKKDLEKILKKKYQRKRVLCKMRYFFSKYGVLCELA